MAELNLEDNVLKLTLNDIYQYFTEEQLQQELPIVMQDIDSGTKELIDTYQSHIAAGNFADAENYRAEHPELETRIWDAYKANSMMAYAAYTYLYAKNQHQQCYFSDVKPALFSEETNIGAVDGDIWFKYTTTATTNEEGVINIVIDYAIPFDTYVLKDGVWCEFTVTPELDIATENDIDEVYNSDVAELTNPESLINVSTLNLLTNKINETFEDLNANNLEYDNTTSELNAVNTQSAIDELKILIDEIKIKYVPLIDKYFSNELFTLNFTGQKGDTYNSNVDDIRTENGTTAMVPVRRILNQTADFFSVTGQTITSLVSIPECNLSLNVHCAHTDTGMGGSTTIKFKTLVNGAVISTTSLSTRHYGAGSDKTVIANIINGLSAGDVLSFAITPYSRGGTATIKSGTLSFVIEQ